MDAASLMVKTQSVTTRHDHTGPRVRFFTFYFIPRTFREKLKIRVSQGGERPGCQVDDMTGVCVCVFNLKGHHVSFNV